MAKVTSFMYDVDKDKVDELLNDTDENSMYFSKITSDVIAKYTEDLDKHMDTIYSMLNSNSSTISIDAIENMILSLANTLYYVGERLEIVGIKSDVAKAARQEIFNKAYLSNQEKDIDRKNKTTVAENNAVAEEQSKYESVIQAVYERTYKVIKFKIDAGFEMLSSLKKVLSRRMQEIDLSMYNPKTNFNMSEDN